MFQVQSVDLPNFRTDQRFQSYAPTNTHTTPDYPSCTKILVRYTYKNLNDQTMYTKSTEGKFVSIQKG